MMEQSFANPSYNPAGGAWIHREGVSRATLGSQGLNENVFRHFLRYHIPHLARIFADQFEFLLRLQLQR